MRGLLVRLWELDWIDDGDDAVLGLREAELLVLGDDADDGVGVRQRGAVFDEGHFSGAPDDEADDDAALDGRVFGEGLFVAGAEVVVARTHDAPDHCPNGGALRTVRWGIRGMRKVGRRP